MQGRSKFTRPEIDELRRLIREKQTADRDRQKVLRGRMRRIGFYISDFSGDYSGFVVSDLDELIARGTITVVDDDCGNTGGAQLAVSRPPAPERPRQRADSEELLPESSSRETQGDDDLAVYTHDALLALGLDSAQPIAEAASHVSSRPGLYAIHAGAQVWTELGLGDPPDERPLYLGKAEDSLKTRDLKTHFGDGRTGQSTLRRSFAALLHDALGLRGMPRNPDKPGYYSNYGLSPAHDTALTRWMREHLELATWPKPRHCPFALKQIETALLAELRPPLNLQDVVTPWTTQVKLARGVMASEARAWLSTT